MRGHLAPGVLALASMFFSLAVPSTASAWTDATVRTASAEIQLTPDGRAHVSMRARVRVDGGWLEQLDLEGLDEDAVLDPERPAVFRDANGIALPAVVSTRDGGRVAFRFSRRTAPHRGEYEIELAWTTALGEVTSLDDDTLRASWVFPAWRYGLDGVEVRWLVPEGASPLGVDDAFSPVEVERGAVDPAIVGPYAESISFRRAHLPRTSAWETAVRVPAAAWPHAAVAPLEAPSGEPLTELAITADPTAGSDAGGEAAAAGPTRSTPEASYILALLLALGGWLKRRDLESRARAMHGTNATLLGAPPWAATLASLALALAALAVFFLELGLELLVVLGAVVVATSWQRRELAPARPRMLALTPVPSRTVRAARREAVLAWLAPAAWLEPTRLGPIAAVAVFAGAAILADGPARALAALFGALVASGTRARLGAPPEALTRSAAAALEALRVELEPPFVACALVARGSDHPTDVRIRVQPAYLEPQLARTLEHLRIEVLATPALLLRASARPESPADLALRAWAEREALPTSDASRRTTVELGVDRRGLGRELQRMLRGIAQLAPRSRDTTLRDDTLAVLADAAE